MNPGLVVGSAALGVVVGGIANGLAARIGPARYAAVRAEVDATGMDEGLKFVAPVEPVMATCAKCGARLEPMIAGRGPVPLLMWLGARGSCRECGTGRRPLLLITELVTAAAFALLAARYDTTATLLPLFVLTGALVAASLVDLAYGRLPDLITVPTLAVLAVLVTAIALACGEGGSLVGAAVGMAVYFGFLLVMHLIWPRGMGFGDVKLALPMGLVIGWLGWSDDFPVLGPLALVMNAALVGSFVGAIGGLIIVRTVKTSFPLGPFLAFGAYVVMLFANTLRAS